MANYKKGETVEQSEEFRAFLRYLKNAGYIADDTITDEKYREIVQKARRRAFHNAEMLLKHYRDYSYMIQTFPQRCGEDLDAPFKQIDKLADKLDLECARGNKRLEAQLENISRSRMRMERINSALAALKLKHGKGETMYEVIHMRYIDTKVRTVEEICEYLEISYSTFWRLRNEAITLISEFLWGSSDSKQAVYMQIYELLDSEDTEN